MKKIRWRRVLLGVILVLALLVTLGWFLMIRMPGRSWSEPLPPFTDAERTLAAQLRRDVSALADGIGPRHVFAPGTLDGAAHLIEASLRGSGWDVDRQEYEVTGVPVANLEVEARGRSAPDEIVVIGAHYDSVPGSPAANDNGSGVAGVLALARAFAGREADRTLRFVLFVNEEPPWFQTEEMGSLVYARRCRERSEDVVAMLALETIGCYLDGEGTQNYPPPLGTLYPSTGDFIGFVGDVGSGPLVRRAVGTFREHARFPSEGAAMPADLPGVGWSDHWAFRQVGYPALMVTDTAPFRYPHYHLATDTTDRLEYERMARVVAGIERVVEDLLRAE